MRKNNDYLFEKQLLKNFLFIFPGVIIIYTLLAFYAYDRDIKTEFSELEQNELNRVNAEKERVADNIDSIVLDLLYITELFEEDLLLGTKRQQIEKEWYLFLKHKNIYDQLRFIDNDGQEQIRVNCDNQSCVIVKRQELQDKSERPYFKKSIALTSDQVYISELDLNIENGEIEQPIKPIIRFAKTVTDDFGRTQGVIIINYKADYLLNDFRLGMQPQNGHLFLLNHQGYWLSAENKELEWGFMYKDKQGVRFGLSYPAAWREIIVEKRKSYLNENGLFTYCRIDQQKYYHQDIACFAEREDSQAVELVFGEEGWLAVSYIPKNSQNKRLLAYTWGNRIKYFVEAKLLIYISILFVSVLLSLMLSYDTIAKERTRYYSEYDGLTNAYNRRSGLVRLYQSYLKACRLEQSMSVCFIDIDGLKAVNDSLGHETGDQLIVSVAKASLSKIRNTDLLIRLGGDEFLLGLVDSSAEESEIIWQRIKKEFERINQVENRPYLISVSHGIQQLDCSAKDNLEKEIYEADKRMYKEKGQARKEVVVLREVNPQAVAEKEDDRISDNQMNSNELTGKEASNIK